MAPFTIAVTVLFIFHMFLPHAAVYGQSGSSSQSSTPGVWERAVEAMQYRRHEEAIPLLRAVLERDTPQRGEAYRLLAHALMQKGEETEGERVLRDALNDASLTAGDRGRIAFDLAVHLGRRGEYGEAEDMYTRALQEDAGIAAIYLNRGNLRVNQNAYDAAVRDYELYLAVRPRAPQRPEIERMIALLQEEIAAEEIRRAEEERRRAAEEEARRAAEEERRRREEEERRAAEERRRRMIDSVLDSLGSAQTETESYSLENEEIREYDEEIDILD